MAHKITLELVIDETLRNGQRVDTDRLRRIGIRAQHEAFLSCEANGLKLIRSTIEHTPSFEELQP